VWIDLSEVLGTVNSDQAITRHRVIFEPPDLIVSAPQKSLTTEEAAIIWKFVYSSTANVERFYWISDISKLERSPPGMRTPDVMGSLSKLHGLACIKGGFAQRTIMTVASRASKLLGFRLMGSEVAFFDDEPAARVWIDSLRQKAKSQSKV
jgi:hypothetical protein